MAQSTSRGSMAAHLVAHLDGRLAARFWAKVSKDGPVPVHRPELGPCWVWTAATDRRGYGRFGIGPMSNNRMFGAHRVSLALSSEIPPDDLDACHHCDNPPCVRPDHLFIGTHRDNMADRAAKGRNHTERCSNGHLRTPENTHIYRWGGYDLQRCRDCDRQRPKRPPSSRKCGESGCTNPHLARGMCSDHYEKWRYQEKLRRRAA